MFPTSTQKSHWMFKDEDAVADARERQAKDG
jgi:hypothetical protein